MSKKKNRTPRPACGVLLYHVKRNGKLSVFLCQANGPRYWGQHRSWWSIPKGQPDAGETSFETACREFLEETGACVPTGHHNVITHTRFKAKRHLVIFTMEQADKSFAYQGSNHRSITYPVNTNAVITYPETLQGKWVGYRKALKMVLPGQRPVLRKLFKQVEAERFALVD